jgi:hypothetical protein
MKAPQDDRRHLTPGEVQKLLAATKGSRNEAPQVRQFQPMLGPYFRATP